LINSANPFNGKSISMNLQTRVTNAIIEQGILPLYFHADPAVSLEVLRALYRAGIKVVEYTNRGPEALSNFSRLVEHRDREMPGMLLGAGTIKSLQDAKHYHDAKADFLVSPGLVPEVAVYAAEQALFYAPGCLTPSEIIQAENLGMRFIKLFPGNVLGPSYVRSIKELFPNLYFMPTGGVEASEESIGNWFQAGVCAVGMGSKLISHALMDQHDYATIEGNTRNLIELIRQIKLKK
jgi:2-dehydro-3-deoxyphosphogluconate aldolase/(4S)-4-hydroxy-2-oxoglutarate aldolase